MHVVIIIKTYEFKKAVAIGVELSKETRAANTARHNKIYKI